MNPSTSLNSMVNSQTSSFSYQHNSSSLGHILGFQTSHLPGFPRSSQVTPSSSSRLPHGAEPRAESWNPLCSPLTLIPFMVSFSLCGFKHQHPPIMHLECPQHSHLSPNSRFKQPLPSGYFHAGPERLSKATCQTELLVSLKPALLTGFSSLAHGHLILPLG